MRVDDRESADIILYLNYPSREPVEVWQEKSVGYDERDLRGFVDRIKSGLAEGKVAAVAYGAYCNGGDAELISLIDEQMNPLDLSAYAGWNTSSNTLGTVICQAVFVLLFGKSSEQRRFLAERIYEDVGYCGHTRAFVTNNILPGMGYDYFNAGECDGAVAGEVRRVLTEYITELTPRVAAEYDIAVCRMPWKRMFEVDLSLKKK